VEGLRQQAEPPQGKLHDFRRTLTIPTVTPELGPSDRGSLINFIIELKQPITPVIKVEQI
jgi:hypothetical protein